MRRSSTSSSENSEWFGLVVRGALFLTPLVFCAIVGELFLWLTGESWPITRVAERQAENGDVLYGRRYMSQDYGLLKSEMLRRRRPEPEVAIVGSSRVMQFRSRMFGELESATYNAGGLMSEVADLTAYESAVASGRSPAPKVLLIGIDPWWVKQAEGGTAPQPAVREDAALNAVAHVIAVRRAVMNGDFLRIAKSLALDGPEDSMIGLSALHGNGFRSDGSYRSGSELAEFRRTREYRDRERPPIISRARTSTMQFAPASGVDWDVVAGMTSLLVRLQTVGVEVFVVMPPFTDEVDRLASANKATSGWWREYWGRLPAHLTRHGIRVTAVRTAARFGLDNTSFLDGMHPGEVLTSHLLEEILRSAPDESYLGRVDVSRLRRERERAVSALEFGGAWDRGYGAGGERLKLGLNSVHRK